MKQLLAQFDLVKPKFSKSDNRMRGFNEHVDYVNNLAERHPGFIWREKNEDLEKLEELWGSGYLYTLSLWTGVEALKNFLYETPHKSFMKRGREWFIPILSPKVVLWWVPEGHFPDLTEAHSRLCHLCEVGPSYDAFDLRSTQPPVVLY